LVTVRIDDVTAADGIAGEERRWLVLLLPKVVILLLKLEGILGL
jgi:hypothetical protein